MNRNQRATAAQQTIAILESKRYALDDSHEVDISTEIAACLDTTRYIDASDTDALVRGVLDGVERNTNATIEVVNETTLASISRVLREHGGPVAALNFASARNPGGGFLGGSLAQEESLAVSSALYASLLRAPQFYEPHRAAPSGLYSHSMIVSPDCPIFRRDDGSLMHQPELVTFITSAAPNAGAIAKNRPEELPLIPEVLLARSERVLALAAQQGCRTLILGAWGCGVFRNDPSVVAHAFRTHLCDGGPWSNRFERIVFAVLDGSAAQETFKAFQKAFAP